MIYSSTCLDKYYHALSLHSCLYSRDAHESDWRPTRAREENNEQKKKVDSLYALLRIQKEITEAGLDEGLFFKILPRFWLQRPKVL